MSLLSRYLLEEFEAELRTRRVTATELLRPGLSSDEMDHLAAQLGQQIPAEARLWWGWHDGAYPAAEGLAPAELAPGRPFLPLAAAVRDTLEARSIMAWKPGAFIHSAIVLDGNGAPATVDTREGPDGGARVRALIFEDLESASDGFSSMGFLIEAWIAAMRDGVWSWDAADGCWLSDPAAVDRLEMPDLF